MSLISSLFNRGLLGAKCKTYLNMGISRIKHLKNKRELQLKHMRAEIAQLLQTGQGAVARIRVEHVAREMNTVAAYEILELFCEFVYARVPMLDSQKGCPSELQEAIASIIFAAPKCSDLPELMQLRSLFASKYGKELISSASELRPDSGVNRIIIEKLSHIAPSVGIKLKLLKDIADEYRIEWDSSSAEAEFHKKHEDLLEGSNQMCPGVTDMQVSSHCFGDSLQSEGKFQQKLVRSNSVNSVFSQDISVGSDVGEQVSRAQQEAGLSNSRKTGETSQSSDILEKAHVALAVAEKASAAARRAAELVNDRVGH